MTETLVTLETVRSLVESIRDNANAVVDEVGAAGAHEELAQRAVCERVLAVLDGNALPIASLSLTAAEFAQLRHHIATHRVTCGWSCSIIERMVDAASVAATDPTRIPPAQRAAIDGAGHATLPPRKEWNAEARDQGESSDYVDGWNDALDVVEAMRTERLPPMTDASRIPQRIRDGLDRYAQHGLPTGDCLRAVLENDLMRAVERADHEVAAAMPAILAYIRCQLPGDCWGSPEVVSRWLARVRA